MKKFTNAAISTGLLLALTISPTFAGEDVRTVKAQDSVSSSAVVSDSGKSTLIAPDEFPALAEPTEMRILKAIDAKDEEVRAISVEEVTGEVVGVSNLKEGEMGITAVGVEVDASEENQEDLMYITTVALESNEESKAPSNSKKPLSALGAVLVGLGFVFRKKFGM